MPEPSRDFCFLPGVPDTFLVRKLRGFFTPERVRDIVVPLLSQSDVVSLRTLDWLVTNYSKGRNILCQTKRGDWCNVFNEYKVTLSAYRRTGFDPFRRRTRSKIVIDGTEYPTTTAQCHFIYWAHLRGILDCARSFRADIDADMNSRSVRTRKKHSTAATTGKRKREALTSLSSAKCHIYHSSHRVSFAIDDA